MTAADTARLEHLLDQLAVGLRRIGIADPLPPGLTAAEISTLTSELPRPLPVELVVFYSWHNGFAMTPVPMPFAPQSLQYAMKRTRERRLEVEAVAEDLDWDPDVIWPRTWLLIGGGYYVGTVVECDVPYGEEAPVLFPIPTEPGPYPQVVASSFTQVVAWWVELLDNGCYGYDPVTGRPTCDESRLPEDLRLRHIF